MAIINSFEDLIVWQKAMDYVVLVYEISTKFPDGEKYGLTSQIRRSVVSIPSNISEGYGRRSTKDYIRFLNISLGSINENTTQLILSYRLGYIDKSEFNNCRERITEISKMLVGLIKSLQV